MRELSSVVAVIIAVFLFSMIGLRFGLDFGSSKACASIGLEWANDKCMKVTREPV